ncbi:MAG: hypothetical protein ACLQIB_30395, partial [Isosphaeraceae bacterium]
AGRSRIFAAFDNDVPLDAPHPNRSSAAATAAAGRVLGKLCEALYADSGASADSPAKAATQNAREPAH